MPSVVVILASLGILQADDALTLLWLGSLVNIVLSLLKAVLAQVTAHGKALLADALHGLGDTAAQVVAALACGQAARPPDREHPWGHGKIESIGTLVVAIILLCAAASIGWESSTSLFRSFQAWRSSSGKEHDKTKSSDQDVGASVSWAAIGVALASIVLKEALFKAMLGVGTTAESRLAVATAWQHRSDSLSAGVALLSQIGAAYGHCYLDAAGGTVVASMLANSAFESLRDSLDDLLDYNPASAMTDPSAGLSRCGREALGESIVTVPGVRSHTLRTRRMGPYCIVDTTIVVDARISASAASMVAEAVHNRVIDDFHPFVTDVVVHVDPDGSPQSHRLDPEDESLSAATSVGVARSLPGHEAVEEQVRQALRSLNVAQPKLPKILNVTELQTYYAENAADNGAFIDVKVDIRLPMEGTTLRDAQLVARAARQQVLAALPGIAREVDVDLELDESGEGCEEGQVASC